MTVHAYLDESGNLSAEDPVVLAGVAWRGKPDRRALRDQLAAVYPGVPLPLHTAHLQTASFRALAAPGSESPEVVLEARRIIEGSRHADCVDAIRATDQAPAWRVDLSAFQAVDRWLRVHHPSVHRRLREVVTEQERQMWSLLDAYGDQAFVIAAWSQTPAAADERYLEMLDALCERLGLVLAGASPPASVVLPSRCSWVDDSDVPLGASVRGAPRGRHQVLVRKPDSYRAGSHPAFFIADFVANRLRRRLRLDQAWEELCTAWPCAVPLSTTEGLPTVAVCGAPRTVMNDVVGGLHAAAATSALGTHRPRWSAEQAVRWAQALGGCA